MVMKAVPISFSRWGSSSLTAKPCNNDSVCLYLDLFLSDFINKRLLLCMWLSFLVQQCFSTCLFPLKRSCYYILPFFFFLTERIMMLYLLEDRKCCCVCGVFCFKKLYSWGPVCEVHKYTVQLTVFWCYCNFLTSPSTAVWRGVLTTWLQVVLGRAKLSLLLRHLNLL